MANSRLINNILYTIQSEIEVSKTLCDIPNNVVICDERSFQGLQDLYYQEDGTIFVIVKFELGTIMYENVLQPATFEILTEKGTFDIARTLMLDFAIRNNFQVATGQNGDVFIQQAYTTTELSEPFEEDGDNLRGILNINATFVYSENVSAITSITINETPIIFVSQMYNLSIAPDTANIGNLNGRTETINKFATFNLTVGIPSIANNTIISDFDSIMLGTEDINKRFTLTIVKDGQTYTKDCVITEIQYEQNIGEIPVYAVSFSR